MMIASRFHIVYLNKIIIVLSVASTKCLVHKHTDLEGLSTYTREFSFYFVQIIYTFDKFSPLTYTAHTHTHSK